MIYFAQDATTKLVKIGFSEDAWARLSKMRADCPGDLSLILVMEGDRAQEARIHTVLAANRVRGEWFSYPGAVEAYVEAIHEEGGALPPPGGDPSRGVQAKIVRLTGLSCGYVSQLMTGVREGNFIMAVRIYRAAGVRIPLIEGATDAEIDVLEKFVLRLQTAKALAA